MCVCQREKEIINRKWETDGTKGQNNEKERQSDRNKHRLTNRQTDTFL